MAEGEIPDMESEVRTGLPAWDELAATLEYLCAYGTLPRPELARFVEGVRDCIQVRVPPVGALVVLAVPNDALPGSARMSEDVYVLAASRDGVEMRTYRNELPFGHYRVWAVVADIVSAPTTVASRIAMLSPGHADRHALVEALFGWCSLTAPRVAAVAAEAAAPLAVALVSP